MKLRLTVISIALSVLAASPVFACDYVDKYKSTSAEPLEQSEAAKKLASLNLPASGQESTVSTAAGAGALQSAEKTSSQ